MRISATEQQCSRIDAELLIPGRGEPVEHATLVYDGAKIVHVGKTSELPSEHLRLTPFRVPVLMPGLWDCHVHFAGMDRYSVDLMAETAPFTAGIRSARDAVATLNAGFTSVREMSGWGVEIKKSIDDGWIPGPRIYSAVSLLSQTSGHGDAAGMPVPCLWDKIDHGLPFYTCDGPDECLKAVRTQIRRGASFIKLAASGGISSVGNDITVRQFNDEELKTIVNEATRNKMLTAAHCHSAESIEAALHAGCRTIEHGSFLNEKLIDLMLEKDAILIATKSVMEYSAANPDIWTDDQYKQLQNVLRHHAKAYSLAIKAGVRCALGTDIGVSSIKSSFNHGVNGKEFKYAVDAGMTPLQAIEAGTATGPEALGPKAPQSGQLKEGYDADFIALDKNPLDHIEILANPNEIRHVWKGGKLCKKDGMSITLF